MNLARMLFKPKWQDKNPAVRRVAVANAGDAELLAALPQLARSDNDAGVRLAALKRLNEYEAWRERSTGDADDEIRRVSRLAYLSLLCSRDSATPPLPRRIAELDTLSSEEIERVATQADDRHLRAAALERVKRPSVLAERAVADPDAALRMAALERVTDSAALERIAERARKNDKAITRRARELIAAQLIGTGDALAIAAKARVLCERMEALMRAPTADEASHRAIAHEWDALGNQIPTALLARYCGADALVRQTRINAQNTANDGVSAAAVPATHSMPVATAPDPVDADALAPALLSVDMLTSQARFDIALANAAVEAQRDREQRRVHLREMDDLITPYTAALESGAIASAHAQHDRLLTLAAMVGELPSAIGTRLAPLHARYDELKQQQQWANRQRREMLCDHVEEVAQAGLHPDALATRLREARDEWQRLDAAEGLSGKSESALARRFHSACHRALKPAKNYFDKRDALRRSHSEEIEQLLQQASSLPAAIEDWKGVIALRQKLAEAIRTLDTVDPRTRTGLAKRIKASIAALAPQIDAHMEAVEHGKKRLVERAAALSQFGDGRALAREARTLQQEWTTLGNGRRGSDQRLWNEFRAACDAAFGKLDMARKVRDAESTAAREQAQRAVLEVEALLNSTESSDSIKQRLRELEARWQPLATVDRGLDQRFRKAQEAISGQLQDRARLRRVARFTQALDAYLRLRAIETQTPEVTGETAAWQHGDSAAKEFESALVQRFDRAVALPAGEPPTALEQTVADDEARDLLVELEFLAGVDTPSDDRQRRMNFQVQRLASRMRDRSATTPEAQLARLLHAWFAQAVQESALEDRFYRAARAAIASLP